MIKYNYGTCPKCGRHNVKLVYSNNPLSGTTICFNCVKENLNYQNLSHADFFCRTYNIPFDPELWLQYCDEVGPEVFEEYTSLQLESQEDHQNLYYGSATADLWKKVNKEWEKCRSFSEILRKLPTIKDSYMERGHLKWGEQYTFEELIKLDSIYTRTLRANNITNPLQREAVKTLCKLQIEMDEAIRAKDAKAIRDFSNAWSTFAKQADLETMINETKTDDITTVAELYDYMERQGFQFKYFDGFDRDEVDRTIRDIQDANRQLILESTGLQSLLEEMRDQRNRTLEEEKTNQVIKEETPLEDLLNLSPADVDIDTEDDSEAIEEDFSEGTN